MRKLLLSFALLPLLDLYVLYRLGKVFGGAFPVLYALTVSLIGGLLARRTGMRVVNEWRAALAQHRPPDEGVVSGGLAMLGCVLLIMPGVISDALGLTLFVPAVRRAVALRVNRSIRAAVERGAIHVTQMHTPGPNRGPIARRSVIDVDGELVEEQADDSEPPKQLPH